MSGGKKIYVGGEEGLKCLPENTGSKKTEQRQANETHIQGRTQA